MDHNGRIVFYGARYGVGQLLARELVTVGADGDIVRIFYKDAPFRAHPRPPPPREGVIWSHHRQDKKRNSG